MIGDTLLSLACSAAIQGTFGRTAAGASTFPASGNRALLSSFTVPQNCDLTRVYLRFNSTSTAGTNAKALVYSNAAGVPGTRLGVSTGQAVPAGGGVLEFNLSVLGLTAGQTIWMGGVTDSFQAVWRTTTSVGISRMEGTTYASPATTWTQSGTAGDGVNVWADFSPAIAGPIVGSASLSLTPSGTIFNSNAGAIVGNAAIALTGSATITNLTPPTTFNFGDETLYTDSLPAANGRMSGKQFVLAEDGLVESISVGFTPTSDGTFNVKGLIYTDFAGAPDTLVAHGTSAVHTTGGGFIVSPLASAVPLTAGTYWLFGMSDDTNGLGEHSHNPFGDGDGIDSWMLQPGSYSFASPPSTFPSPTATYDYNVGIYATYSVAAAPGAIVGNAGLTLGASATLTGAGSVAGTAAIALAPSLVRAASGQLVGTAAVALTPALARGATGQLVGATTIALAPALTRAATGALVGTSSIALAPSGNMGAGAGPMVGTASLALTASATLSGLVPIVGTAAIALAGSATAAGTAAAVGSASLVLTPAAVRGASGALAGSTAVQLAPAGTLQLVGTIPIVGTASITLAAAAAIAGSGRLIGASSVQVAPAGTVAGAAALAGTTSLTLAPSAAGNLLGALNGAAVIAVSMVGQLLGRLAMAGNANLTFTCSVAAGAGYDRPPIQGTRPVSLEDGAAYRPNDPEPTGQRPGSASVIAER